MSRRVLLLAALLCAGNAFALDTYRFGSRLVEIGDSASKLIELAGEPAYKERIETAHGGREGERWQYVDDGKSIMFEIRDGKIASIEQIRN
ncbi:MAG TPA: DUF2845 domain-containing protein [Rudaea sp.]|nr:DUF2845 domain-containing protein [Rudaea sp.]